MHSSSPAMYINTLLSLGFYFDCQYLKHYSMTLLCSTIILSSSPLKFCVLCLYLITFVYNVFVIRNNIPAISSFHCSYVNTLASDLYKALSFLFHKSSFFTVWMVLDVICDVSCSTPWCNGCISGPFEYSVYSTMIWCYVRSYHSINSPSPSLFLCFYIYDNRP